MPYGVAVFIVLLNTAPPRLIIKQYKRPIFSRDNYPYLDRNSLKGFILA